MAELEPYVATSAETVPNAIGRCPACSRFIGLDSTCPYCDCPAFFPRSFLVLRYAVAAVAFFGLSLFPFLFLPASESATGNSRSPSFRGARNAVIGVVTHTPYVDRSAHGVEGIALQLDTGRRTRRVVAETRVARALIHANALPRAGDGVAVQISEILADGSLRLTNTGQLTVVSTR